MKKIVYALTITLTLLAMQDVDAKSKEEINAGVNEALQILYKEHTSAKELTSSAKGILVFPSVVKAGIGIGGEYGEGALLENGSTTGYYNTAGASIGFQLGVQSKKVIILFMTNDALKKFKSSEGWEAGVDGSVAIAKFGAGGDIDTKTANQPVIGFIVGNKGLMYNLTLEGSKITKIEK